MRPKEYATILCDFRQARERDGNIQQGHSLLSLLVGDAACAGKESQCFFLNICSIIKKERKQEFANVDHNRFKILVFIT